MTTEHDHGEISVRMISCTLDAAGVYQSRVLAVRDMRAGEERIVAATPEQAWDTSLIDVTIEL